MNCSLHWCVYISPPCQCFEISRKHYKEFCDCFGFGANALTRTSRSERMGETLITFVLFINFFSFVCVFGFFITSRQSEFSVLGKKNVVWDIRTLASRIFCWISVVRKSQKYSCRKFSKKKEQRACEH